MANVGMDVEQVTAVHDALKSLSTEIQQIVTTVEGAVNQSHAAWFGADSDLFLQWWSTEHRPALTKAGEDIAHLAEIALANANEQSEASSSSGTAGGTASGTAGGTASGTSSGGAPAGGAPANAAPAGETPAGGAADDGAATVPGNPAIADKTAAFTSAWNGVYLDFDGASNNQCYDLFQQYNQDVVGAPPVFANSSGGAKDIYNDYATNGTADYYDQIPADTAPPQVGDVVVWDGAYGHVGVVSAVGENGFTVFEQNSDGQATDNPPGSLPTQVNHGYGNGLLGFLRPKG